MKEESTTKCSFSHYCATLYIHDIHLFLKSYNYNKILYFSALGTVLTTIRPSWLNEANVHASATLHATEYTLSSWASSNRVINVSNFKEGLQHE